MTFKAPSDPSRSMILPCCRTWDQEPPGACPLHQPGTQQHPGDAGGTPCSTARAPHPLSPTAGSQRHRPTTASSQGSGGTPGSISTGQHPPGAKGRRPPPPCRAAGGGPREAGRGGPGMQRAGRAAGRGGSARRGGQGLRGRAGRTQLPLPPRSEPAPPRPAAPPRPLPQPPPPRSPAPLLPSRPLLQPPALPASPEPARPSLRPSVRPSVRPSGGQVGIPPFPGTLLPRGCRVWGWRVPRGQGAGAAPCFPPGRGCPPWAAPLREGVPDPRPRRVPAGAVPPPARSEFAGPGSHPGTLLGSARAAPNKPQSAVPTPLQGEARVGPATGGGRDAVLLLFGWATKARRAPHSASPSARRANSSPHPQLGPMLPRPWRRGEEEGLDPCFLEHTSPSTLGGRASRLLRQPQRCRASPPRCGCCMAPREWRRAPRPGVAALGMESPVGGEEGTPNPCELTHAF